jgi:hypothetical protein
MVGNFVGVSDGAFEGENVIGEYVGNVVGMFEVGVDVGMSDGV